MICIPLLESKALSIVNTLKKAQKEADLVEIWFDEIENLDAKNIQKIFNTAKVPILYKWQGKNDPEPILREKPKYIDVDLSTKAGIINFIKNKYPKTKVIISFHDFEKTPDNKELKSIIGKMRSKGADIIKIATTANRIVDSIRMLKLLKETSEKKPAIFICMGEEGKITRATGHLFGNYLMYAPLNDKGATASGQIPVRELKKILWL